MALNSPATDIRDFLATQGVGTVGVDLFTGREPEEPHFVVTVFDSGGIPPNPKFLRDEPQVQCLIRGNPNDYENTWAKAQEVKDVLLGAQPRILNGTDYVLFTQIGEMLTLGYDDSSRLAISSNWQLVREMQSGGNRESF